MEKGKKETWRTIIVWVLAIASFIVAMGLAIYGVTVPPPGEIHASVLTFVGEILTWVSAVLGIGEFARIQLAKIEKAGDAASRGEKTEE